MGDRPDTGSQALVPKLGRKSPGKEYNPLFSLMGRAPKRAAKARHSPTGNREGAPLPGEVRPKGKRWSHAVEFQGLREAEVRGGGSNPGS